MNTTTMALTEAPMTIDEVKKIKPLTPKASIKDIDVKALMQQQPETVEMDGRIFIKGMESVGIKVNGDHVDQDVDDRSTDAKIPEMLGYDTAAKDEPKSLRKPKFIDRNSFFQLDLGAQTIFGPDNRRVFYDTRYPWGCCGRVETALGIGSGVMIGPRHLLTCSHIIDWRPNNTTGYLKFTPSYYNGSRPFGDAYGIKTYYKFKVAGPTIDGTEIKYDYTVVVLDRKIGNTTGWLGSKSYSDSWDGLPSFTHVGYPGDLTGTQRPTYQGGIALDGDFWSPDSHESMSHKADIWPGQSGGPFWAYWGGAPYAVAVQSAHNPSNNFASGGSDMVDLVIRARNENP